MRIRIKPSGREALTRPLERAALAKIERAAGQSETGPQRPPQRAALRPWPGEGEEGR